MNRDQPSLDWKTVHVEASDYVDIKSVNGERGNCWSYAFSTFDSRDSRSVYILCGTEDGIAIWLNGARVLENLSDQSYFIGTNVVGPFPLRAGENSILVQSHQVDNDWGFGVYLRDNDGWPAVVDW